MSTTDAVADFCALLREWPSSETFNERNAFAVGAFTTLYFRYDPKKFLEASLLLVDLHEEFEQLIGKPYVVATHPESEVAHPYGSKRLPDLRIFAQKKRLNKIFWFSFSDEKNPLSSPNSAATFWRTSTWDGINNNGLSSVQLYYSWTWWQAHRESWRAFILSAADRLGADQVYSGFALHNPPAARYEAAIWERSLTPHFFGLDIDFPNGMNSDLEEGIRPPTWGFLLSNRWRDRLGLSREQVQTALADPHIHIVERDCGQWIELGDKPSLLPVEEGLPYLQMKLNQLLRPIRAKELDLIGFGPWDGDPKMRFSVADSQRWMARFDEDSDWPSETGR